MQAIPDRELPRPILLCVEADGDAGADLAESAYALLCGRRAIVLSVWHQPLLYERSDDSRRRARLSAVEAADRACAVLISHGWVVERHVVADERASWRVALELAEAADTALVAAGPHDGAAGRPAHLGGPARALARHCPRPVLILPPAAVPPARAPALMAFDGSKAATDSIEAAARLLRPRPATVATVWHPCAPVASASLVTVPAGVPAERVRRMDEESQTAAGLTAASGADALARAGWTVDRETLESKTGVAIAIADAADDRDAAVIVVGTHGHSRFADAVLGSTSDALLQATDRAMLLVPPERVG
jgi:nucleotide-binding universal stress UspA family protein